MSISAPSARGALAHPRLAALAALLAAAVMVLSPGCGPSAIPRPVEADLKSAGQGVEIGDLREGRDIYVRSCSGCHRLYRPVERSSRQWEAEVSGMSDHVTLTAEESKLVLQYLRAYSADRR